MLLYLAKRLPGVRLCLSMSVSVLASVVVSVFAVLPAFASRGESACACARGRERARARVDAGVCVWGVECIHVFIYV
jgi:hypothetical protein